MAHTVLMVDAETERTIGLGAHIVGAEKMKTLAPLTIENAASTKFKS
ncbi:hypothetical protein [Pseudoalteromonas sp. SWN166]|nr:hypothetical protein [Pseudoalteromonas sp. SWN166]MBH0038976.1 hypothetical protein [Pseudoalteromonas sp. SWN166]